MYLYSRIRSSATKLLIVINVVIFIILFPMQFLGRIPDFASILSLSANFQIALTRPWTLFTYMFVHYSFWHLLVNMLWLWMFGQVLELTVKYTSIYVWYITGGVAGGIFYLTFSAILGSNALWLTGSSAAVLAITVIAGFKSPDYSINLLFLGNIRLKWIAIAAVILIFIGGGGGFSAHLGGAVAGLLIWTNIKTGFPSIPIALQPKEIKKRYRMRNTIKAMQNFNKDNQRLDELIDKIRVSGHDSLTQKEKNELALITRRLKAGTTTNIKPMP